MANITRKEQTQPARTRSSDPFRMMRDWMRWDPFGQMMPVQSVWNPQFEVRETADSFLFKADLPGVKEENVDIQMDGNRLQISGHREDEHEEKEGENVYAYERSYGSFSRAFTLPENADTEHVACDLKGGVLTLVVPKKKGAAPRKIQIGGGAEKKS